MGEIGLAADDVRVHCNCWRAHVSRVDHAWQAVGPAVPNGQEPSHSKRGDTPQLSGSVVEPALQLRPPKERVGERVAVAHGLLHGQAHVDRAGLAPGLQILPAHEQPRSGRAGVAQHWLVFVNVVPPNGEAPCCHAAATVHCHERRKAACQLPGRDASHPPSRAVMWRTAQRSDCGRLLEQSNCNRAPLLPLHGARELPTRAPARARTSSAQQRLSPTAPRAPQTQAPPSQRRAASRGQSAGTPVPAPRPRPAREVRARQRGLGRRIRGAAPRMRGRRSSSQTAGGGAAGCLWAPSVRRSERGPAVTQRAPPRTQEAAPPARCRPPTA